MVILIDKIHLLNIPFLLLLSFLRMKVYYFSIQPILRNKKIIFFFDTLNLKFVNHSNQNLTFKKRKGLIMYQSTLKFKKIISSYRKKIFNNNLKYFFKDKAMFEVFFFKKFHKEFERLTFMNEFGLTSKKKYIIWFNNFIFLQYLIHNKYEYKMWRPKIFIFLNLLCYVIDKIIKNISRYLRKKNRVHKKITINEYSKDNYSKINYIFFPHRGIKDQYVFKNYFLISKKTNLLKFIFIEWNYDFHKNSFIFYKKKKVNFCIWDNIIKKKNLLLILISRFSFQLISNISLLFSCYQIEKAYYKLSRFKNVKKIFVGDEVNFPSQISIAAKRLSIQIIAYQKRISVPAHNQLIIDKYFLLGNKSKNNLFHQIDKKIKPVIVGNFILNSKSKVKFYPTKKFKYKCLVLDQHVKTSWYFKSINPLINETNHKIFLNNVIKLSNKFPDILFVVKSKDEDWKDDKIYRPLFKKLNRMKNLRLFKNKKYIQNLDLLNSFDFALGKPTSILDDFLSYGKPIVVFDNDHRTKYTIKYPNEIFTDDYFNLELKIEKILSDYDKIMNKLNKTKNFFFKKFDKNNYEKILNKILDEKDKL